MKRIKITLRKKEISNGMQSLYLDYYPPYFNVEEGEYSRREFLKLYLIAKPRNQMDKVLNIENLRMAELICSRRQNEVNKEYIYTPFEQEQLRRKKLGQQSFIKYFRKLAALRIGNNRAIWDCSIKHFENFLKNKDLKFSDVTADLMEDFKSYLLTAESLRETGKTLSQNTSLSYFNKVKATLRKAYKQQMLVVDINAQIEGIKENESERNYLTKEEAVMLFNTPCEKEIIKRVSLFSILTGFRYSDIAKLQWNEVHKSSEGYLIRFRQQKTQKYEMMPISDQAASLMGVAGEPSQKVFEGLKKWDIDRGLPIWIKSSGITKHVTFHCFRHTYATLQITAGTDIFTVSKMLGHKNIKTTQVYTKLVDGKKREAAGRIKL